MPAALALLGAATAHDRPTPRLGGLTEAAARAKAARMAEVTGQAALLLPVRGAGWDAWPGLDLAAWLAEGGEVILPAGRDKRGAETRLRQAAQPLRGRARLLLLEAALRLRGQGVRAPR